MAPGNTGDALSPISVGAVLAIVEPIAGAFGKPSDARLPGDQPRAPYTGLGASISGVRRRSSVLGIPAPGGDTPPGPLPSERRPFLTAAVARWKSASFGALSRACTALAIGPLPPAIWGMGSEGAGGLTRAAGDNTSLGLSPLRPCEGAAFLHAVLSGSASMAWNRERARVLSSANSCGFIGGALGTSSRTFLAACSSLSSWRPARLGATRTGTPKNSKAPPRCA